MAKEKQAPVTQEVAIQPDELTERALALNAEANERAKALQDLGVETKDLVIASIQVMQNTSALVGDDKAKLADIVNMQTEEIVGGVDKPVLILPLRLYKTLRIYDVSQGFKFLREEPLTPANDKLSGEAMEDGVAIKRYHTFNFFVLLKSDLEKGEGFPCLLRFRSTGMHAGRTLATYLYKLVFFKRKPYTSFLGLSSKKEKKDTNTYAVPVIDTKNPLPASPEQVKQAEDWLVMLAAGNYKVDDRDEGTEEESVKAAKPTVIDAEVVGTPSGQY